MATQSLLLINPEHSNSWGFLVDIVHVAPLPINSLLSTIIKSPPDV